jgi:short-subunit dehydrogenase
VRLIALVTGASGGIGYELCQQFAKNNYDLILVARDEEKLKKYAEEFKKNHNTKSTIILKDLSSATAADEIYQQLKHEHMTVDVLVNNAGFGSYGKFSETDLKKELSMIQVNVVTLTHLTKLLLPGMLTKKSGKILNVASTAAFFPGPLMAVYYATKAFVYSFSQAIRQELKDTGVSVTVLCPGPTRTGFEKGADLGSSKLFKKASMNAKTVAEKAFQGLMANKPLVIPGIRNKIQVFSEHFVPRNLISGIVENAQKTS